MNFDSIENITRHFELESNEKSKIKKDLKNLLKKVHPDKNNGEFRDENDQKKYLEIHSALEFIDKNISQTSLVKKNEITALTQVIEKLVSTKKNKKSVDIIKEKGVFLNNKLQDSIQEFHKKNSTPRITGVIATVIVTTIWAFPNIVKNHPLLSVLYKFNREFTIIWLFSLFVFGLLWLKIKTLEKKDEEIKKSYKLESKQNYIFNLFIIWLKSDYRNYEVRDEKRVVKFSKDDLIDFLITKYEVLQRNLNGKGNEESYEIENLIRTLEKEGRLVNRTKNSFMLQKYKDLFPKPGEIDFEIAHLICDLIIDRLNAKEAIKVINSKKLSDIYEYEDEKY